MKTGRAVKIAGWACLAVGTLHAAAQVERVSVRQRWPWNRLTDIDYVLKADPTQAVDIAVSAYNGSEALAIPPSALSGDRYDVREGARRIVLDPSKTPYSGREVLTQFRVELVVRPVPVYMIVDLSKSAGEVGQVEYVYPGDSRLVTEGRYTNVWFDVTNDTAYATASTKLVLRRLSSGSVGMGVYADVEARLTQGFYAGVFEVTQRQWELVMGEKPNVRYRNPDFYRSRPVESVTFNQIRGAVDGTSGINWPATGDAVSDDSFLGRLRERTGLGTFDLPTEAQWEYLCRAGTTTVFNDGLGTPENAQVNDQLDVLGRYRYNGGKVGATFSTFPDAFCGPTNGTATVGSYRPNGWGLYDTHGNVSELCLDWYEDGLIGGDNPVGPSSGSSVNVNYDGGRVFRSGSWADNADSCHSGTRQAQRPDDKNAGRGFRLILRLP